MLTRRLALAGLLSALALPASAETPGILSAKDAAAQVERGEILLLDIRTREEWAETGIAKGAWPVSMHEASFAANLRAVLDRAEGRPIALICATGGRSKFVQSALDRAGIEGVLDVSEGMMGSPAGPGWLRAGLPVVTTEAATQSMPELGAPAN